MEPSGVAVSEDISVTTDEKRLFVPLAGQPFEWFSSGRKRWELRKYGRQYTEKHLVAGRRVELRRGYSTGHSLWGTLARTERAESIARFFDVVPYSLVVPGAASLAEAIEVAHGILGTGEFHVIGFEVGLDPAA